MPASLRSQPTWTYWHARALKQAGDVVTANQEFESISQQFNFYGQLAEDTAEGILEGDLGVAGFILKKDSPSCGGLIRVRPILRPQIACFLRCSRTIMRARTTAR